MYWFLLFIAIILETIGTTEAKLSQGFTKMIPSLWMLICYVISFVLLAVVLKRIEVSTAYAIWSGLGTALIAVIGIYFFQETINFLKIISIALIIFGVIGLHLSEGV